MIIGTDRLRELIQGELPELTAIRHDLHAHPELGYQENRTSGVVHRELAGAQIALKGGLAGGTGVLGHLPGRAEKAVGLRADMDALPIQETAGLDWRSQHDGVMHACGHDGHTTILIGAARVLSGIARDGGLPRPVTFVFQPAEEGGAGAQKMVEAGCLDGSLLGPPVEQMFGLHGWPSVPLGVVGTRPGPITAAADAFDITVRGTACHAAWPDVGQDPIVAAAAVVTALQTICSRSVSPLESVVVSVTQVHGGTTYNIIPGEVALGGTVWTLKAEVRDLAEKRVVEVADAAARAHGCRAEANYRRGYPATVNDPTAVAIFSEVAAAALGDDRVIEVEQPVMGGEDFTYYGQVVPACFFVLGPSTTTPSRPAWSCSAAWPSENRGSYRFPQQCRAAQLRAVSQTASWSGRRRVLLFNQRALAVLAALLDKGHRGLEVADGLDRVEQRRLPDPDRVAVGQFGLVGDTPAVDEHAVGALEVLDAARLFLSVESHLHVTPRDHLVHDLDVGVLVAPDDDCAVLQLVVIAASLTRDHEERCHTGASTINPLIVHPHAAQCKDAPAVAAEPRAVASCEPAAILLRSGLRPHGPLEFPVARSAPGGR
jgi:amidohydrolase